MTLFFVFVIGLLENVRIYVTYTLIFWIAFPVRQIEGTNIVVNIICWFLLVISVFIH